LTKLSRTVLRTEIEGKVQELKQEISDTSDLVSEINQIVANAQSKVIQIRNEFNFCTKFIEHTNIRYFNIAINLID
jgi:uncharacterized coiled-coil protein SlyX